MMVAFLSLSCAGVKIIDFVLNKGVHNRLPIFMAVNIYIAVIKDLFRVKEKKLMSHTQIGV